MEFLADKVRHFRALFTPNLEVKKREMTKCEGYFELVYKVLSWEDITLTLCVFLVANFLFWLVVQLQLRLFGIAFLLVLAGFLADFYLEGSPLLTGGNVNHLEAFDELKNDFTDVVLSLKALRKDSPSSFCFGASVLFLAISFIAKNVSGYVLFYFSLLGVFFIPLLVTTYAPDLLINFKRICRSLASDRSVLAEDELIPFIADKDFTERDPDLDSLLTDRTADSVTNSLISGLTSMPSYLDEVDKDLEEEDLLPSLGGGAVISGELSSDSDSDHKAIRFESKHFNGDSSSDEDLYPRVSNSQDLEVTEPAVDSGNMTGVLENIINVASVSGSVLGNILKSAISNNQQNQAQARKNSSSDSEFEIISPDEAEEQ